MTESIYFLSSTQSNMSVISSAIRKTTMFYSSNTYVLFIIAVHDSDILSDHTHEESSSPSHDGLFHHSTSSTRMGAFIEGYNK